MGIGRDVKWRAAHRGVDASQHINGVAHRDAYAHADSAKPLNFGRSAIINAPMLGA